MRAMLRTRLVFLVPFLLSIAVAFAIWVTATVWANFDPDVNASASVDPIEANADITTTLNIPLGDYQYAEQRTQSTATSPDEDVSAADLDDDGIDETIVRAKDKVHIYAADGSPLRGVESNPVFDGAGDPVYQPGWPIVAGGVFRSSPAFADINSDGMKEVIVGCDDQKVHVWTAYGQEVSGWPQSTDGDVYSSPAVADIDGDRELEILAGAWWGEVYAWERDGQVVAGYWPRSVSGRVGSSPAIGDIDQDSELEVLIASYYGVSGTIYGFEHDGSDANGWPVSVPAAVDATPALADIDDDAKIEVVIGAWEGYRVYAFNGEDGSGASGWPVTTFGYVHSSAAIGDVDGDGDPEIVVGDSWWGGHVWVFEGNGSTASGWPVDVENNVVGSPSLADLDEDGDLEIVIPSSIYVGSPYASKLWAFHHDGRPFGEWPVAFGHSYERAEGNPMIGDIDADGELEFVVGTGSADGIVPNLYAFNLDTASVAGWPLSGEDIYVSAAAGDIDNDYRLEIAAGSWPDYTMHVWELAEDTSMPDLLPWPKFHHDLWNTGFYPLDGDGDGFADSVEAYLGTDRLDACPDVLGADDAWPLDIDMNKVLTIVGDVLNYAGRIGATGGPPPSPNWMQRLDLNKDNIITVVGDVVKFSGKIGQSCT